MGSASVEPSGELSVYPDSTVYLDCIVVRRAGTPEWSSTASFHRHRIGIKLNIVTEKIFSSKS